MNLRALLVVGLATLSVALPAIGLVASLSILSLFLLRRYPQISLPASFFIAVLIVISLISFLSFTLDFLIPTFRQFWILHVTIIAASIVTLLRDQELLTQDLRGFKIDPLPLVLAVIAAAILLIPAMNSKGPSEMIYFLSSGEDNASHFAMFNRAIHKQSPPYFDSSPTGLIDSLNVYPQGIHVAFGYFFWTVMGEKDISISWLLRLYYLMSVLTAAGFIYVCAICIQRLIGNGLSWVGTLVGTTMVFVGVLLFLMGWGFVAQIGALTYVLALYYVLSQFSSAPHRKTVSLPLSHVLIIILLAIGITYTWYLLLLVAAVVAAPFILQILREKSPRTLALAALASFAVLAPIALNYLAGKGSGALNEDGGVYKYELLGQATIALGAISVPFFVKRPKNRADTYFLLLIGGAALLTLGIMLYQLATAGNLTYYFYKSLYLPVTLSIIAITVLLFRKLPGLTAKYRSSSIGVASLAIFAIAYLLLNPVYPRVYVNNWFNHLLTPGIMSAAVEQYSNGLSKDVLYVESCDMGATDYTANRWSGAMFLSEDKTRGNLELKGLSSGPTQNDLKRFTDSHDDARIVFITCTK